MPGPEPADDAGAVRAWLLLDVDGVLSPLADGSEAWPDWVTPNLTHGYHLLLSQQLGDAVRRLPLEPVWLTTWLHEANEVIAPFFGWPQLPVLEFEPEVAFGAASWPKLEAAAAHIAAHPRPFVWIDDHLLMHRHDVRGWASQTGLDHLLISPDPRVGLEPSHVRDVAAWAEGRDTAWAEGRDTAWAEGRDTAWAEGRDTGQ